MGGGLAGGYPPVRAGKREAEELLFFLERKPPAGAKYFVALPQIVLSYYLGQVERFFL